MLNAYIRSELLKKMNKEGYRIITSVSNIFNNIESKLKSENISEEDYFDLVKWIEESGGFKKVDYYVYKMCPNTHAAETVSVQDFAKAYIIINYEQDYNNNDIIDNDEYYTLSAPSPKFDFQGEHKTLVLKKEYEGIESDLLNSLIEESIKLGIKEGLNKAKKAVETELRIGK